MIIYLPLTIKAQEMTLVSTTTYRLGNYKYSLVDTTALPKKLQDHKTFCRIGRFQSIKTGVLLIFSFITSDKTEFLSPMMFSKEYIAGI